jgi:tungstate transport system substrate-binding protein
LARSGERRHIALVRHVTILALSCAALACGPRERPLRLGTTTTVAQSGMLAVGESLWTGPRLATIIGPSGQILHSAAQGDLDLVLTHAPALEAKLLAGAAALARCPFVTSRFAVVGPGADPAGVAAARSAADAFQRIAAAGRPFVSRGDSSGTHERELAVWRAAGINPTGRPWYLESGTDQTTTLRVADERGAYALGDLPTLATRTDLSVRPLFSADSSLLNRYTLTLVRSSAPHPAARDFMAWALDTWRARVLAIPLPDGTAAFEPGAGTCEPAAGFP